MDIKAMRLITQFMIIMRKENMSRGIQEVVKKKKTVASEDWRLNPVQCLYSALNQSEGRVPRSRGAVASIDR